MFSLLNKTISLVLLLICSCALQGEAQQVLKGRLLYGANPAKGVKVILAPRNSTNEKITDDRYFYGTDLTQLQRMNAVITVTNSDGWYFFNNIPPGSYIVKVCQVNGTNYKFNFTETRYSFKLIPDLPAASN